MSTPSPRAVLLAFLRTTEDNAFVRFEMDYSSAIAEGVTEGYRQKLREDKIVYTMVASSRNLGSVSAADFQITTRSNFIHGRRSWVTFPSNGGRTRKELGDAVFIISIVHNGRVYFRRMTIIRSRRVVTRKLGGWTPNSCSFYLDFPGFEESQAHGYAEMTIV
ncbi:MAG TPA: hypothetical protein VGR53_06760 [Nitrososphaerales archaeon]|nr:hypothetical protein [Nitrososphaerales archaeon]